MKKISKAQALEILARDPADNYVGHATVRVLGLEPATDRRECRSYDQAIVVKPRSRLEFGREYTVEEIEAIGFDIFHIVAMPATM